MVGFAYPYVLYALALPLLVLHQVWTRRGRNVVLPFDHGRQRSGAVLRTLINGFESLPALLLAVVIVICAGPQRLGEPKTKRVMTNIEFCVDVSGSMTAEFGEGTRYDASMKAIDEFLDFRSGDAFGLTFFGNSVLHWVPLTFDTSAIRCSPPFMRPEVVPNWFGGTEIGKALRACQTVLTRREEGDRMIILVSDGESSDLNGDNDMKIAKELKQHNIVVYAIHIGGSEVPGPIANITGITGGHAFEPGDPQGLRDVFLRIDQMQQTKLEKTLAETMDYFFPFAVAGLSLLALIGLASLGMRYTPW
jgi:Ca-activated chloride channel homolog